MQKTNQPTSLYSYVTFLNSSINSVSPRYFLYFKKTSHKCVYIIIIIQDFKQCYVRLAGAVEYTERVAAEG